MLLDKLFNLVQFWVSLGAHYLCKQCSCFILCELHITYLNELLMIEKLVVKVELTPEVSNVILVLCKFSHYFLELIPLYIGNISTNYLFKFIDNMVHIILNNLE